MTDEQTANVVKAINDTLTENKATLGDAIWILSGMAVRFIETTADKSAHNILKMELAQLQEAIQQRFEIHEDEIVFLQKQVETFKKAIRKQNKQNYHILKTIGRPIPGHQHQSAWNRTRSNPKLR